MASEVESKNDSVFGTLTLIPSSAVIAKIKTTKGQEAKQIEQSSVRSILAATFTASPPPGSSHG